MCGLTQGRWINSSLIWVQFSFHCIFNTLKWIFTHHSAGVPCWESWKVEKAKFSYTIFRQSQVPWQRFSISMTLPRQTHSLTLCNFLSIVCLMWVVWAFLIHLKRLWCWEGLRAGEGDDRGWDGWMASPTPWTWIWVRSGRWWRTGRPGVLQFVGSQRVGHDWATELNWTEDDVIDPS